MWRMKDKALAGVETEKLKKNFGVYAILLTALFAMTFFGVCDPMGKMNTGPSGSAAVVDGEVISRTEFDRAYRSRGEQMRRMYGEAFDPGAMQLASTVMNELVDGRAMYIKAVDLGLKASDEEIYALLAHEDMFKDEKGAFSDDIYDRFLKGNGYSEASFVAEVRRNVTLQKFRRFVADTSFVSSKAAELDYRLAETKVDVEYLKFDPQKIDVAASPEDVKTFLADEKNKAKVKEYFDGNPREFNQAEQIKGRHILVQFAGARNASPDAAKRDKDAAKKKADEILAKVQGGADFATVAKESTDEAAGKTSGGDLGWFTRDAMDKAFSDAAFALGKGETSGVVESPFGFHIIRVEDKKDGVVTKLEDAEAKIAQNLLAKEKRPALAKEHADNVLAALKANQPVDNLLAEYKLAWAATGETGADAKFLPGIGSSKEVADALSSLVKPGDLFPSTIDVRGNLFILRLKSRKEPDMAKFDKEKKRQMALTAEYTEGNTLFEMYAKQVRADLDKKQKVSRNAKYLALDQRNTKDSSEN